MIAKKRKKELRAKAEFFIGKNMELIEMGLPPLPLTVFQPLPHTEQVFVAKCLSDIILEQNEKINAEAENLAQTILEGAKEIPVAEEEQEAGS